MVGCGSPSQTTAGDGKSVTLLNVSYDPTRELYRNINEQFAADWRAKHGQQVTIKQSHAGSGSQARAVIDGLQADIVTLALAYDVNSIQRTGKRLGANWQTRYPNNSAPYTSTIVFLVRKGNPKQIRDWSDLVKPGIAVVTPNPKTSGGARWNYLAAWGYQLHRVLGPTWLQQLADPAAADTVAKAQISAEKFVATLYARVPVLDSGARGATNTFVQREIGDALLAWESEALLAMREAPGKVEIIVPSISIVAEPPVAVVDTVVDRRGTRQVAEAYLNYLYSPAGQEIGAKHFFRPRTAEVLTKYRERFPQLEEFGIDAVFDGWQAAHAAHFADGAAFDRLYAAVAR
jgi:sulfate transport system substrate-binding protein